MADHILFSVPIRDNQAVFNTSPVKMVEPMESRVSLPYMNLASMRFEQIGSKLPQKMQKDFLIKPDNQRSRLDISCMRCGSHSVSYLTCLDLKWFSHDRNLGISQKESHPLTRLMGEMVSYPGWDFIFGVV